MKKIKLLALGVILSFPILSYTQNTNVLWDKENNIPVSFANIFSAQNGKITGTTSNLQGNFTIDFSFDTLQITHVSYINKSVTTLKDTVYLIPKDIMLGEVIIDNAEPAWIRPFFYRLIKEKQQLYKTTTDTLAYNYITSNLKQSDGYWFENSGSIVIPSSTTDKQRYFFAPNIGYIHYKDTTAGCDFQNMKRMLYHDFVDELNKRFVKNHLFIVNDAYKSNIPNRIQLLFKSKKYGNEDKGYITLDTTTHVILRVSRETGYKYNLSHNTDPFTRASLRTVRGMNYTNWITNYEAKYQKIGEIYYPQSYRIKLYLSSSVSKGKFKGNHFDSSQSEITLNVSQPINKNPFIELPKPYYMKLIVTKKERLKEDRLQKIPLRHVLY